LIRILTLTLFTLEGKTPPVAFPLAVHPQLTQSEHRKTPNLSILQIPGRKSDFCKGLNWTACSHLLPPSPCCVHGAPSIRCSGAWSCLLWVVVTTPELAADLASWPRWGNSQAVHTASRSWPTLPCSYKESPGNGGEWASGHSLNHHLTHHFCSLILPLFCLEIYGATTARGRWKSPSQRLTGLGTQQGDVSSLQIGSRLWSRCTPHLLSKATTTRAHPSPRQNRTRVSWDVLTEKDMTQIADPSVGR